MIRAFRPLVALAVLALVAESCGGTASPSPSNGASPSSTASATPGEVVEVRWFCCLGGGDATEQVEVEKAVAEAFNASHPNSHLTFEAVAYAGARDALSTQIASGNGPDIMGPVGIGGAEAFHGQWLDLQPYIDKTGYDTSSWAGSAPGYPCSCRPSLPTPLTCSCCASTS